MGSSFPPDGEQLAFTDRGSHSILGYTEIQLPQSIWIELLSTDLILKWSPDANRLQIIRHSGKGAAYPLLEPRHPVLGEIWAD